MGFLALGAMALRPVGAAGQEPELERLEASLPPGTAASLWSVIEEAREEGIPSSLLVDKALEGAAKGVTGERLVSAVGAYAERLRAARSLVGPDVDATGLVAAADALRRGVPAGLVRSLAREHPASFDMLLIVYGDLLQEGVPADEAYGVVDAAARQGVRGDDLLSLPGAVRRLIREGARPVDAAAAIESDLKRGRMPFPLDRGGLPLPSRDGVPDPGRPF